MHLRPKFLLVFLAVLAPLATTSSAFGRAEYNRAFWKLYEKELGKYAETVRCNACHYANDKKNRNDYGQAVGAALGGTGITDAEKIAQALKKAANDKSGTEGKTFGELIKDGKLPGKRPNP
jgi:hypothetical protein